MTESYALAPGGQPRRGLAITGVVPQALGRHLLSKSAIEAAQSPPALSIVHLGPLHVGTRNDFHLRTIANQLRVYSIRTPSTTVSVICVEPSATGAGAMLEACDRMATTLDTSRLGGTIAAGTGSSYYSKLREILGDYNSTRKFLRKQLARERARSMQARAARQLAVLTSEIESRIQKLHDAATVPSEQRALERALTRAERAYKAISTAALAGAGRSYVRASMSSSAADRAVGTALREISAL